MKRNKLTWAVVLLISCSLTFSSCIGSFSLTNKLLKWNGSVGDKFVNELVFLAFWILPVYEISALADVVVINSIEFWSGSSPIASSTQTLKGEKGEYVVECNEHGYKITDENEVCVELRFDKNDQSWTVVTDNESYRLLSFIDDNHVKMYIPEGKSMEVELSQAGTLAFRQIVENQLYFASR